jgi:hypothetical protein
MMRVVVIPLGLCLLLALPLRACDTPVYRYALEHWPADNYRATVLHRGPLAADAQRRVDHLKDRADSANLSVQVIDLDSPPKDDLPERWRKTDVSAGPALVLNYPATTKIDADAWSGPLTTEAIEALLDSPVRREAAGRLHAGETVWLLLESGTKEADDAAAKMIADNRPAAPASTLLRVRRSDPAEKVLVSLLLGSESELAGRSNPMAFPVFGRGRVLYALVGAGITAEHVREAGSFLAGDCSCKVKDDNPGTDLLLTADWGDLTPGTGRGDVESLAPRSETTDTDEAAVSETPQLRGGSWSRAALWVAVVFAGGLVVLTGALALRSRKQPTA